MPRKQRIHQNDNPNKLKNPTICNDTSGSKWQTPNCHCCKNKTCLHWVAAIAGARRFLALSPSKQSWKANFKRQSTSPKEPTGVQSLDVAGPVWSPTATPSCLAPSLPSFHVEVKSWVWWIMVIMIFINDHDVSQRVPTPVSLGFSQDLFRGFWVPRNLACKSS